jgi:hypothetical protein
VIYRAILHVDGPAGSGKTTLVEALLRGVELDMICMRAIRDQALRRPTEGRPRAHPELQRYRAAGALGIALYRFPQADSQTFYESDFMTTYSDAVVVEGDCPLKWVELTAFVARPLSSGAGLLERVKRNNKGERKRSMAALERALATPESTARLLLGDFGERAIELALQNSTSMAGAQDMLRAQLAKMRSGPPPTPTEHWAVTAGYQGVEQAQVVVFNVQGDAERRRAESLVKEVKRLRTDEAVSQDVIGPLGNRVPITVLIADLSDPRDPGLKKALTRIKRSLRTQD